MTAKDLSPFLGHTCTILTPEREYKGVADQIEGPDTLVFLEFVATTGGGGQMTSVRLVISTILAIYEGGTNPAKGSKGSAN